MDTYLVRLKPHNPRRGHVLRRYTYRSIKFQEDRGWYRVDRKIADYLRGVRQIAGNEHSPLAFDVCTPQEAHVIDAREQEAAHPRKAAGDDIDLSTPREDDVPGEPLPKGAHGKVIGGSGDEPLRLTARDQSPPDGNAQREPPPHIGILDKPGERPGEIRESRPPGRTRSR